MRLFLFILISFVGLTATICGLLLIAYPFGTALGMSLDLLRPTFLNDFLLPGIILTTIGATNLAAVFAGMLSSRNQYNWSMIGGIISTAGGIIETLIIQTIVWLHIIYFISGILIILLSWQLKGKWAV